LRAGDAVHIVDRPKLNSDGKYADFLLTVLAGVAKLRSFQAQAEYRTGLLRLLRCPMTLVGGCFCG
jgi:hypothetical protein